MHCNRFHLLRDPRCFRARSAAIGTLLACLMILLVTAPGSARALEISVVVHPELPMSEISVTQLREIYLGEMTFWKGARLVPITFQTQTPAQATFLHRVLGISGNAYKTYWIKRIFREGGIPPLRVASEEEMMHLVARTPGAIGFVPADLVRDSTAVRQVLRISDQ